MELKCAKRKASYKSENLAKIGKRMHAAKDEGVASDNVKIRVTKEHNFDGSRLFQSESAFLGNLVKTFRGYFKTLKQQSFIRNFRSVNFIWMCFR